MKDIKLRAYDKKTKKIWQVQNADWFINSGCTKKFPSWLKIVRNRLDEDGKYIEEIEKEVSADEIKIMQYTGLKDKNGKEIYEGDIVKCGDNKGVVRWDGIELKPFDHISGLDYAHGATPNYTQDGTEVIGNIYENPELIK